MTITMIPQEPQFCDLHPDRPATIFENHFSRTLGDTSYKACSPECEQAIIEDICRRIAQAQRKRARQQREKNSWVSLSLVLFARNKEQLLQYLQQEILPDLQGGAIGGSDREEGILYRYEIKEEPVTAKENALISLPMGKEDMLLAELLATYLLQSKKKKITDMSVGPLAINILVALEHYRQSKDSDAFAQELGIPAEIVAMYKNDYRH